ncbi:MAG: ABC transporter substrate-binding protein [Candidatus Binatia bacterium]
MKMRRFFRISFLYSVFAGLAWLSIFSIAQAETAGEILKPVQGLKGKERTSRLIEGAKKEGRLVFYGSSNRDASGPFLEAFRKAHPYLTIGHYRSGSVNVHNKVVNEARAGKHEVDIIENDASSAYALILEGFVDPYQSVEAPAIRPEFNDPKSLWHAYQYLVVGLGFNKGYVKESEAPKSYDDLLQPRWKGKMSLDTEDADLFGTMLQTWGEEKGLKYFRKLAKQEITFRRGHTLQSQLLIAGESAVAPWLYSHRPLMAIAQGASIGLVFLNPVISIPKMLLLAKRSPHPHAAALFIDWALSTVGQHFVGMVNGRSPVRKGQKQKWKILAKPTTVPVKPEVIGPNLERYTKLYHKVLGIP